MKVFVVISVFNRKAYTLQCLALLKSQTYNNFEIVVVDDGSTDGTSNEIAQDYPDVKIVKGDGNWWWTKSMNRGAEKAIELGADVIITLNNDTVFDNQFIEKLIHLYQENPNAVIGSLNLIKKEKEYIFFSGLKEIIWWKAKEVKYHKAFTPIVNTLSGLHPTKCLNGRGTVIPVDVFKAINGYDEINFPQYASDYDFALRAQEKGFQCVISYDVKVYSFIEETGEGKSFVKQSWSKFFKSFSNTYSQTSLKLWQKYYYRHAPMGTATIGFLMQILRTVYAFIKKRNLLSGLD